LRPCISGGDEFHPAHRQQQLDELFGFHSVFGRRCRWGRLPTTQADARNRLGCWLFDLVRDGPTVATPRTRGNSERRPRRVPAPCAATAALARTTDGAAATTGASSARASTSLARRTAGHARSAARHKQCTGQAEIDGQSD
jgi:hypothetical protein